MIRRLLISTAVITTACPSVLLAQTDASAGDASADRQRQLTALYRQAQEHYLAKRYTEALPLFEEVSRELQSPNAQLYVARCHRELGDRVQAHAAMTKTVEMATARAAQEPRFATTRDEAAKELAELDATVGRVVVLVDDPPEGLVVEVAGRAAPLGQQVVVEPGEVRIDALVPGRPLHRQRVQARAGAIVEVHLVLPQPPAPAPSPVPAPIVAPAPLPSPEPVEPVEPVVPETGGGVRIGGYVLLGASAAGFVTFAVAGVMANKRFSDVEDACGGRCTDPSFNDDIDGGRTMDLVANVGLGVGLGLGVAGALMVIFGGPDHEPAAVSLRAGPLEGGGVVGIGGRF